jgi:hypothetical protein
MPDANSSALLSSWCAVMTIFYQVRTLSLPMDIVPGKTFWTPDGKVSSKGGGWGVCHRGHNQE